MTRTLNSPLIPTSSYVSKHFVICTLTHTANTIIVFVWSTETDAAENIGAGPRDQSYKAICDLLTFERTSIFVKNIVHDCGVTTQCQGAIFGNSSKKVGKH